MTSLEMFIQNGLAGSAWGGLTAVHNPSASGVWICAWCATAHWPLSLGGFVLGSIAITFMHRRKYVIGHGRIGMLAMFEYVTLELIIGAPLYLSTSRRIKFVDIPSGLAMISKVLAPGWLRVISYCFYSEVSGLLAGAKDFGNFGFKPPLLATMDPQLGM